MSITRELSQGGSVTNRATLSSYLMIIMTSSQNLLYDNIVLFKICPGKKNVEAIGEITLGGNLCAEYENSQRH